MTDVRQKLTAARLVLTDPRLRTLLGKETQLVEEGNVYGDKVNADALHRLLDDVFAAEIARKNILALVEATPLSVAGLAERTGLPPHQVFRHVLALQQKGLVDVARVEDGAPLYKRVG
jgi:predicted Rossmann fold nucleotide-binding protein DprA/Smf involved in DNA uptake